MDEHLAFELAKLASHHKPMAIAAERWELVEALQVLESSASGQRNQLARLQSLHAAALRLSAWHRDFEALTQALKERLSWHAPMPEKREGQELALAAKLLSMSRFLSGQSGLEDFGALRASQMADLKYGLGFSLNDGSLWRLFLALVQRQGLGAEDFFSQQLAEEGPKLYEAILSGRAAFEDFWRAQLVLRYDAILSRKIYQPSSAWLARMERLSQHPELRQTQIELLAGERLEESKKRARRAGITSLRGMAFVFDVANLLEENSFQQLAKEEQAEEQKWLKLSDAVLKRVHGKLSSHWHGRLSSLFHGRGIVDGRIYEERRFLGENAEKRAWEEAYLGLEMAGQVSDTPREGYDYIVRHGDKLSQLTHQAYGGRADYRFVLRQNPQLQLPLELKAGTRLFFPNLDASSSKDKEPVASAEGELVLEQRYHWEGERLFWEDRCIENLGCLSATQREALVAALADIPCKLLARTTLVELEEGCALVCEQRPLFLSTQDNERYLAEQAQPQALLPWARQFAAEIRGAICLSRGQCLALGYLPHQKHRRAWIKANLERHLEDPHAGKLRANLRPRERCVDFIDAQGQSLLSLEEADFHAMRLQPKRRLNDYFATPLMQMQTLSQLWYSDLMGLGDEILLAPLSRVQQYAVQEDEEGCFFVAPMGTAVYPIMAGRVLSVSRQQQGCQSLEIAHAHGLISVYEMLATLAVEPGQWLNADVVLGRSGASSERSEPGLSLKLYQRRPSSDGDVTLPVLDYLHKIWPERDFFDMELKPYARPSTRPF